MSTMLLGMMEGGCVEGGIPIEGADDNILRLVAAYYEKHGSYYDPDPHSVEAWDHKFISDLRDNHTTSNLVTASSASPTSSPTSASSQDADLGFQMGVTELLIASPTRCSTLNLYRYTCVPAMVFTSSVTASNQDTKLDILAAVAEHLLVQHASFSSVLSVGIDTLCFSSSEVTLHASYAFPWVNCKSMALCYHCISDMGNNMFNISSANQRQGDKVPKPPWLLGTGVFRSWYSKMQFISGFLLEVSPWCRDYMVWVQRQPSMTPPVQLKKTSRGLIRHCYHVY